jgi:hypothetical protein
MRVTVTSRTHFPFVTNKVRLIVNVCLEKTAVWDIVPCSSVEVDRRFRGAYYIHHQDDLLMEAVCASETSVYFH